MLVAREQRHGQRVIGRQRLRSRVGQARADLRGGGTKSSATKRTLKAGTGFRRSVSSCRFLFFFLPLSSTHNTETYCVCSASETTDQHSLSSRSPALRIRVQPPQNPRHSDHRRQFMYSSRRSQRLAVPDPPKLQPFRILRRPCSNQITND